MKQKKERCVEWVCDGKNHKGFLPKYQHDANDVPLANHPRHIAIFDNDGKRIACVSPSASFYSDMKKHVIFRPEPTDVTA